MAQSAANKVLWLNFYDKGVRMAQLNTTDTTARQVWHIQGVSGLCARQGRSSNHMLKQCLKLPIWSWIHQEEILHALPTYTCHWIPLTIHSWCTASWPKGIGATGTYTQNQETIVIPHGYTWLHTKLCIQNYTYSVTSAPLSSHPHMNVYKHVYRHTYPHTTCQI